MITKGEWKHLEDGVILSEDGKQLASVFPRNREANARLIAAAPELLEACKATHKYFLGCFNAWSNGDRKMPQGEEVVRVAGDDLDALADVAGELIIKAIAKAEAKE